MDPDELENNATRTCTMNQCMIDFTAKHLNGLRQECAATEQITQKEVREAESKIIKLFSNQLVAKRLFHKPDIPHCLHSYPHLQQWLAVVGLEPDTINNILEDNDLSFDSLMEMNEIAVSNFIKLHHGSEHEIITLQRAFNNLRLCTDALLTNENDLCSRDWHFTELFPIASFGDTAKMSPSESNVSSRLPHGSTPIPTMVSDTTIKISPTSVSTDTSVCSELPDISTNVVQSFSPTEKSHIYSHSSPASPIHASYLLSTRYTPPTTPKSGHSKKINFGKHPITPPTTKKFLSPDPQPLQKSKSHESHIADRIVDIDPVRKKKPQNIKLHSSHETLHHRKTSTDGADMLQAWARSGQSSPILSSPMRSPINKADLSADEDCYGAILSLQKSPRTLAGKILHEISHRFTSSFVLAPCDQCGTFVFRGKVCRFCRKKYHKDCSQLAPPFCGLTDNAVDTLMEFYGDSPHFDRRTVDPNVIGVGICTHYTDNSLKYNISMPIFFSGLNDSGSNTSCESSSPSSPALVMTSSGTITSPSPASASKHTQFQFPDTPVDGRSTLQQNMHMDYKISPDSGYIQVREDEAVDTILTNTSNDSEKTVVDLCATSEHLVLGRVESVDSQDDSLTQSWCRQDSLAAAMREWDIPYEDLVVGEVIGKGRFGSVNRGYWHGDVAIKSLDLGNDSNMKTVDQLTAFRLELAVLRKTRHENLVLFMGACMKPPRLAIVTSFCRGETLYTLIHVKKEKFKINKAVIIASQVRF